MRSKKINDTKMKNKKQKIVRVNYYNSQFKKYIIINK